MVERRRGGEVERGEGRGESREGVSEREVVEREKIVLYT